jgi:hypothetical protein
MKKKRAMKAITEDWTDQEEEELAFITRLQAMKKGGVGMPDTSEKKQGALCKKAMQHALVVIRRSDQVRTVSDLANKSLAIDLLEHALASCDSCKLGHNEG